MEKTDILTGHDLTAWGHDPGPQFPALLERANTLLEKGGTPETIRAELASAIPPQA